MPEFIIHIGPHKTGSSYLQNALGSMADQLHGRGVLYPGDLGPKGHIMLAQNLAGAGPHAEPPRASAPTARPAAPRLF
jgi:hypothetical protein